MYLWAREDDNNIEKGLPYNGTLKNGNYVNNYYLLEESILLNEGWIPVIHMVPEYNQEIEYISEINILKDGNVYKVEYEILQKPIPEINYYISEIKINKDKEIILSNNQDILTIIVTFEGEQVDTFNCYITINGIPIESIPIVNGEIIREFTSETSGVFKIEFSAGEIYTTTFIEVVEVIGS
jgi:hypothetical protein